MTHGKRALRRPGGRTCPPCRRHCSGADRHDLRPSSADRCRRRARPRAAARACGATARRCALSDIADLGSAGAGEELVAGRARAGRRGAALLDGVDAVVHLGGISVEGPFEPILQANIVGVYNLYEAARRHGVERIVFASSNHVTGFYRQDEVIDAARRRCGPDGHYGLSKAFGENLSRFYFDRYGIETVCLRIGSSFPEPKDRRMLATWLSYDDLERLVVASLTAPVVGHSVVYGMSDNTTTWWDNTLGRAPRLPAAATAPSRIRAARRGAPARARPQRSGGDLPGRRLRDQGPVRMSSIDAVALADARRWRVETLAGRGARSRCAAAVGESPLWSVAEQAIGGSTSKARRCTASIGRARRRRAGRPTSASAASRLHARRRLRRGDRDRHLPARPASRRPRSRPSASRASPIRARACASTTAAATAAAASGRRRWCATCRSARRVGALYRFDGARPVGAARRPASPPATASRSAPDGRDALPLRLASERAADLGLRSRPPTARSRIGASSST